MGLNDALFERLKRDGAYCANPCDACPLNKLVDEQMISAVVAVDDTLLTAPHAAIATADVDTLYDLVGDLISHVHLPEELAEGNVAVAAIDTIRRNDCSRHSLQP